MKPRDPRDLQVRRQGSKIRADLQLIAAAIVWTIAAHVSDAGLTPEVVSTVVSLAGGALVANVISVTILVVETLMLRR